MTGPFDSEGELRGVYPEPAEAVRDKGFPHPDRRLPKGAFPTPGQIARHQFQADGAGQADRPGAGTRREEELPRSMTMAFMERIATPSADGELTVVRLLRHYCGAREDDGDGTALSRLVALGQTLRLPPAGTVALVSVFQLTEAVLGRRLATECCCSRSLSADERAVIRLLGSRMPTVPGTGTADIPHGLPGALAWAVLSVRWLCGGIVALPSYPVSTDNAGCPFPHRIAA